MADKKPPRRKPARHAMPRVPLVDAVNTRTPRVEYGAVKDSSKPRLLSLAEKRQTAFDLRIMGHALRDIGVALGVTEARACQLLKEKMAEVGETTTLAAKELLGIELERLDQLLISYWPVRGSPKAADIILKICERRAKLAGMDAPTKVESSGAVTVTPGIDLTRLDDEELVWLERIMNKSASRPLVPIPGLVPVSFDALPPPPPDCSPSS